MAVELTGTGPTPGIPHLDFVAKTWFAAHSGDAACVSGCDRDGAAGAPHSGGSAGPSTLAVDLASEAGMTLVGFLRGSTMNIYAGAERVTD